MNRFWVKLGNKKLRPAYVGIGVALLLFLFFWFVVYPVGEPLDEEAAVEIYGQIHAAEERRMHLVSEAEAGYSRVFFLAPEGAEQEIYYVQLMKSLILPRYTLESYSMTQLAGSLEIFDYSGVYSLENWAQPQVLQLSKDSPIALPVVLLRYGVIALLAVAAAVLRWIWSKKKKPDAE